MTAEPVTTQVVAPTREIAAAVLTAAVDDLTGAETPAEALAALDRIEAATRKARERIVVALVLDDGWTYAQAGRALRVTRQAARQTYAPAVAEQLRRRVRRRA